MTGKWHLCPTDEMHLASTRRNVSGDRHVDLERAAAAMIARE